MLDIWAQAVASGIPDELFWKLTPVEVGALMDDLVDIESRREKNAALRAGLVASAVYNVHRPKNMKALKASDFVKEEKKAELTAKQERDWWYAWAQDQNAWHARQEALKAKKAKAN